jgi:hypothetical protein
MITTVEKVLESQDPILKQDINSPDYVYGLLLSDMEEKDMNEEMVITISIENYDDDISDYPAIIYLSTQDFTFSIWCSSEAKAEKIVKQIRI